MLLKFNFEATFCTFQVVRMLLPVKKHLRRSHVGFPLRLVTFFRHQQAAAAGHLLQLQRLVRNTALDLSSPVHI